MSSSEEVSITVPTLVVQDTNARKNNDNSKENISNKGNDDTDSIFTVNQDLPIINNSNAITLQSQDGRKLQKFNNNDEEFIKILRSLNNLSDQQIRIIEVRYLNVLSEYRNRIKLYDFTYHFSRIFISLGGVAVPALLSIQSPGQLSSVSLYWFTWVVSLAVTVIHNISNIFRFDKKYQGIHTTIEKLHSEGWRYLQLSGRYSAHDNQTISTHANQYLHFVNTIEKIKNKQTESEYNAPPEDKTKDSQKPGVLGSGTGTSATATLSDTK